MGMARPAVHHLRVGGLLHDIGKIGVRDTILLKPEALTPDERRLIEQHPTIGLRILERARLPREVLEIVGGHHERLNGSGYPLGLSADEIGVFPRVTAVADMYDAMTTDRPYRPGLSPQEALRILTCRPRRRGHHAAHRPRVGRAAPQRRDADARLAREPSGHQGDGR
jgi:putative nucleotidyltransferase with HDIG domain